MFTWCVMLVGLLPLEHLSESSSEGGSPDEEDLSVCICAPAVQSMLRLHLFVNGLVNTWISNDGIGGPQNKTDYLHGHDHPATPEQETVQVIFKVKLQTVVNCLLYLDSG
eukprot:c29854_g1_i1 orf=82-411(+)